MSNPRLPILKLDAMDRPPDAPDRAVVRPARPGFVLHRGPFPHRGDVWALDLVHGCTHDCAYCPSRAKDQSFATDDIIPIEGVAGRLSQELKSRLEKPRAVILSPTADPFQANPALQLEALKVAQTLAEHRISSWLTTRGSIEPEILDRFAALREHVHITVALPTLDPKLQQVLEPRAASPRQRLALITALKERRIPFEVALEPLVPGLSDTPDRLHALLASLAEAGVRQVTAGYLVLRPGLREQLEQALAPIGWSDQVLAAYDDGPMLRDGGDLAQFLHKSRRQRGYALVMSLAAELGISVRLSELGNPDFRGPVRRQAGHHIESLTQRYSRRAESHHTPGAASA
jgi:DNA repair photolyase